MLLLVVIPGKGGIGRATVSSSFHAWFNHMTVKNLDGKLKEVGHVKKRRIVWINGSGETDIKFDAI